MAGVPHGTSRLSWFSGYRKSGITFGAAIGTIAATELTEGGTTTDGSSFATASVTPTADKLQLAIISTRDADDTAPFTTPTASGNGLTWVLVGGTNDDDPNLANGSGRMYVFRAMGSAPTSGAVTFDFGTETQSLCMWWVGEFAGTAGTAANNGSEAINQSVFIGNSPNGTSHTTWLGQFSDTTNNATVHAVTKGIAGADFVEDTGFTLLANQTIGTPNQSFGAQFKRGEEVSPTMTWTTSASNFSIALELRASGAPANNKPKVLTRGTDTTDDVDSVTDSVTPTADTLVLVYAASRGAAPRHLSSISGAGITNWVNLTGAVVDFSTIAAPLCATEIWGGYNAAPSAGALTLTWDGSATVKAWSVVEIPGADLSGGTVNSAVVQAATGRTDSGTSVTATLAAFAQAKNMTIAVAMEDGDGGEPIPKPGDGIRWLHRQTGTTPAIRLGSFFSPNSRTTAISATGVLDQYGIVAVEVKAT